MKVLVFILLLSMFCWGQEVADPITFYSVPAKYVYSTTINNDSTITLTYANISQAYRINSVTMTNDDTASVYALYDYNPSSQSSKYDGWPHIWIWTDTTNTLDTLKVKCTPLNAWLVPITDATGFAKFPDNSDSTQCAGTKINAGAFPVGSEGYRVDPSDLYDGKCAGWLVEPMTYGTHVTTVWIRLIK